MTGAALLQLELGGLGGGGVAAAVMVLLNFCCNNGNIEEMDEVKQ